MRIVVSGGGTVGHVSPVLATVDALRRRDKRLEVLYIGQGSGVEAQLAGEAGLRFAAVAGGKFRRDAAQSRGQRAADVLTHTQNFIDLIKIACGTLQCLWLLWRFRPQVVFNKVGPAGLPVGLAASLLGIPMVIHEPDVTPGLANRILSRWARTVAVGFPAQSYRHFGRGKLAFTGTPVTTQGLLTKAEARRRLKLGARRPLVVVTGGSLGAMALNTAVLAILPELMQQAQVYHLSGQNDYRRVAEAAHLADKTYHVAPKLSLPQMQQLLAAADVVVARAGANTIAELANLAKPTILVPNRQAAAHQLANAAVLEKAQAAIVIDDQGPQALLRAIQGILTSRPEQQRLSTAIKAFAHPDAADSLADVLVAAATKRGGDS